MVLRVEGMGNKIAHFFRSLYKKLFKIDDSPQKIALGFGLGVFLGIFPGTGPLAAIFLSLLLRVNRAAALIGSLLTNTWSSLIVLFLALQLGSLTLGIKWQDQPRDWGSLFKLSFLNVVLPIAIGYILVGLLFGFFTYLITLIIIKIAKKER
ncbi:MAG: DUF2062 domain-containing protein [Candidatus Omnitrophota bacterium]|jgi:uncharacterized protein (DUF2062 family)